MEDPGRSHDIRKLAAVSLPPHDFYRSTPGMAEQIETTYQPGDSSLLGLYSNPIQPTTREGTTLLLQIIAPAEVAP